ncbi:MAG TPA: hypothetical protein VLK22_03115 [Candidatus Udaeobacter sp.]|nr:hypothetical protein [Candidatus Udaeobacter sp.]
MLKKFALSAIMFAILLMAVSPVRAQTFGLEDTARKAQYSSNTNIYSVIGSIISIVLSIAGLVFLVIILYAGLRWMTARGNEEFVSKAKEAMYAAIIGFILVSVSYGLTAFIFGRLVK